MLDQRGFTFSIVPCSPPILHKRTDSFHRPYRATNLGRPLGLETGVHTHTIMKPWPKTNRNASFRAFLNDHLLVFLVLLDLRTTHTLPGLFVPLLQVYIPHQFYSLPCSPSSNIPTFLAQECPRAPLPLAHLSLMAASHSKRSSYASLLTLHSSVRPTRPGNKGSLLGRQKITMGGLAPAKRSTLCLSVACTLEYGLTVAR